MDKIAKHLGALICVVVIIFITLGAPRQALGTEIQASGYELPWKYCTWQTMTNGWGNPGSHSGIQMWYAYDFGMSIGVPVRATRGGTVTYAKNTSAGCGDYQYRNDAKYVTVAHNDGTATLYLHLSQVYVSVGQAVAQGQTVGLSGNTGWTGCAAHLHFQRQAQGGWVTNSTAIYFDEYPGTELQDYQSYRSLNYWGGDNANCPMRMP